MEKEEQNKQIGWIRRISLTVLFMVPLMVLAQSKSVSGKVMSVDDGLPMQGITVIEKGTVNGTITDINGKYSIKLKSHPSTLVFSMIGMESQEFTVKEGSVINVKLKEDTKLLDEVVVTGYTSEKKADITGAVSVVKMKDIASIPSGNVMSTLQGRVAGMNVINDGTPGGVNTTTSIRGVTTINNNTPLYIIDGVPTRDNIATLLNPNDVESIQVLKDAASASIYGTQAANGVIIITTKKAKQDQLTINFDGQFTLQTYRNNINMLNAQQWGDVYWAAYNNDGIKPSHDIYGNGSTPVIPAFIDLNKTIPSANTNWADEIHQTSLLKNYNVSVMNGSKYGSSSFSFNYFDQAGLIKETGFKRYNVRANSNYKFLQNKLRIGENLNVSQWNQVLAPGGIEELAIKQHPIIPVYDINGGYAGPTQGLGDAPNPIRLLDEQSQNTDSQWRIFGNLFTEIEPLKNLILKTNFGLNYRTGNYSTFSPKWSEGDRTVDKNSLYAKSDYDRSWIWTNTIAYNITINENHTIKALLGEEAKETYSEWLDATRQDYLIENPDYRYISAGDGAQTNGGLASRVAMVSYFGKINYSYQSRYLLSGTIRRDASSRFGTTNNAGIFPAVSAGWRINKEAFMKNAKFIDDLKLRLSWGKNGNDLVDNEATYTKYITNANTGGYDINGNNQGVIENGIVKDRTGNPNIKWEVTTQTNIGLDGSLLNNQLSFTLDYYLKQTKDMLIERPYIGVIGEGGTMAYNGASLKNNGFEGAITWRAKINKDLSYEATFTATAYKNEITDLPTDIYYTWGGGNGIDKSIVGQPLGSWMGYKTNGLYRSQSDLDQISPATGQPLNQPGKGLGRIRYVDTNGDGVIDSKDMTWLGSDQPKFIAGLNLSVKYKQFDCSVFFNGMVRDAWNNAKYYTDFFQLWTGNHGANLLNAWTPDNYKSNIPALTANNNNDEGRSSDYFIEDGSYIKLKNMQIGYTLPNELLSKFHLANFRVYVQGQNLVTFTHYSGANPEGLGYPYPLPRTFTFGFNFGF